MKTISHWFFLLVLIWLHPSSRLQGAELKYQISGIKEAYVVGEPVILRCVFSNDSSEEVLFDFGRNDEEGISFILQPDSPDQKILRNRVHRGGGDFTTQQKVRPGQTISRYLLLDQWYRPTASGVFEFALVTNSAPKTLKSRFVIKVKDADPSAISRTLAEIDQKLTQLQKETDKDNHLEYRSYKTVSLLALSYLTADFDSLVRDFARQPEVSPAFRNRLEEGRGIGPGGVQWLD